MATTGLNDSQERPAANVRACCSAMPTSKYRSGNSVENCTSPDPSRIAGVIATNFGSILAISQSQSPKTFVKVRLLVFFSSFPVDLSNGVTP